jgi:hypothetical protein
VIVVNKAKLTEEVVVERRSTRNRRPAIDSNSDQEMKPAYKSDIDSSDSEVKTTRRPPGRPRKSSSSDNEIVRNKSNVRSQARHNDTIMERDSESSEEEMPRRGKRLGAKSAKNARAKSISVAKRQQEAPMPAPRAKTEFDNEYDRVCASL